MPSGVMPFVEKPAVIRDDGGATESTESREVWRIAVRELFYRRARIVMLTLVRQSIMEIYLRAPDLVEQVGRKILIDHDGARGTFGCAKAPFHDGVRGGGGNGGEGLRDLVLEAPCCEIQAAKFLVGVQMREANSMAGKSFS